MTDELKLTLRAARVGAWLGGIALTLTAVHVLVMSLWFNDLLPADEWWQIALFDLDEEESFGTWFSAIILLAAGLLSLLQSSLVRHWSVWWLLLGMGFLLLSIDEVVGLHEYLNTQVEDTPWTTFGAAIVLVVGLLYIPFLLALPASTRYFLLIAGAIYVGGAVGVERATDWYDVNDQLDTLAYNLWTAVEECMEMAGIVLYIYALLRHLASGKRPVRLLFVAGR